jgi:predicted site-specific integrase-resolvase
LSAKGWRHEIIPDLGSGLDYKKKGLQRLLELILFQTYSPIGADAQGSTVTFGSELIFALCEIQNIEIVIINKGEPPSFEPRT